MSAEPVSHQPCSSRTPVRGACFTSALQQPYTYLRSLFHISLAAAVHLSAEPVSHQPCSSRTHVCGACFTSALQQPYTCPRSLFHISLAAAVHLSAEPTSHQPCSSSTPVCGACFTSALQQPYTCLQLQISGFRAAALWCCVQHSKTALQNYRTARFTLHQKLNFRHVHFLCNFCVISGGRKTAARLFVRLTYEHEFATHVFVLQKPQDYRKITME